MKLTQGAGKQSSVMLERGGGGGGGWGGLNAGAQGTEEAVLNRFDCRDKTSRFPLVSVAMPAGSLLSYWCFLCQLMSEMSAASPLTALLQVCSQLHSAHEGNEEKSNKRDTLVWHKPPPPQLGVS